LSFRPSGPDRPPPVRTAIRVPRWPRQVLPVLAGLVALAIVIVIIAGVWTDYLWYSSVSYGSVFGVVYGTRWALFAVGGIVMAAVTGFNAVLAFRLRPVYRPTPSPRPGVEVYRQAIDPHRRLLLGLVLGLVGIIAGVSTAGAWRTWLLFVNQVPFGHKDPQFNMDISFFVFTYPFLRLVLSYLFVAVFLSLIAAAGVHWLYGGLGWQGRRPRATIGAQAQLFVLLGVFVLLKGAAYFVDRYGIDFSQRGTVMTGASYTDVNAVLPAKTVLAVIAVLCALLFFAGAIRRSAMLPAVGFGLLVLSAILIGGVYPAIIQQFVVKPNELAKESKYIGREIHSTRLAYGINKVSVNPYPGVSTDSSRKLAAEVSGLPGIRQMDPAVVSESFQQLQQVKGFYQFPSILSVDRYPVTGATTSDPRDVVIAARGLPGPPPGQGSWFNTHLVYTHGFGVVAATADNVGVNGNPAFIESDIPPTGELTKRSGPGGFEPRVYFGPQQTNYAIVGAPKDKAPVELDFPDSNSGSGQVNYTYTGNGGVPVGSVLNRLLYSVKFRELNILISGAINSDSRILYDRDPLARVAKVAPWLTLDGSPYPVVADNQILWVVDGYTTTDLYPYSQRLGLAAATATSQTPGGSVAGAQPGQINYLRNSVKAVVNAFTGQVTLYQWGANGDPMLRAWDKAFPGVVQPAKDIPSWLKPHLRYPSDLFEVQRQILAQYHVVNPQSFYGGQNFWEVPNDPTGDDPNTTNQPPYYLTMDMPGYHQPEFSLSSSFVPRGRANAAAFVAVDSNPTQPGYGTIRVLQLPQDTTIPGPSQVQNFFENFPTASKTLSLLRQGGSRVILGNLIMLPVGDGLLYIEPVYVAASAVGSTGSTPELKQVFAFFNGQPNPVGFSTNLSCALAQVFTGLPGGGSGGGGGGGGGGQISARVQALLAQAQSDYAAAQAALAKGDFATYGKELGKMKQSLDAAQQAAKPKQAPAPGATPTPTPSAAAGN
jgi:uncharacterized protein